MRDLVDLFLALFIVMTLVTGHKLFTSINNMQTREVSSEK
jgi:hypothetical protein